MKLNRKNKISCLAVFILSFSNSFSQKLKESINVSEKKITICHLSDSFQVQSISIPYSALIAHIAHGDIIGDCSSENSPLKLTLIKTDVKCNGESNGAIDMEINFPSGNPPFIINWSNGEISEDISNLSAGAYSVTVSISNGLSASASVSIQEPEPLLVEYSIKNVSCAEGYDGEISASPSGGSPPYSIFWKSETGSQSGTISKDLPKGIFQVMVSDGNGCQSITAIPVKEPKPMISKYKTENVLCFGGNDGNASINPEGGTFPYSFVWSSNTGNQQGKTATGLSKGNYSYTVTDANGCKTSSDFFIDEPLPLKIDFSVVKESCSPGNDGNAIAFVSGGISPYSFQWDLNANSQINERAVSLSEGNYNVLVSDINGCTENSGISVKKDKCECMLRNEDCGATMSSLAQFIYCNPVDSATNYQWEFSHSQSGFSKTIQRGFALTNFYLTWVPGIQYGKTYEVRIKPFVNGVWKDYGPVCQVIVPAPIPYTKLRVADCGLSTTTLGQVLFCDFVAGAQNYQWEFSNADIGFHEFVFRGSNSLTFTLGWVPGLQYGKTYDIRVRANVGGEWGDFGDDCQVSLVYPIPTTKVRFADCGKTITSLTQFIYCDAVSGAMDYQWELSNNAINFLVVFNRNSPSTNFQFSWIPDIPLATTFDVRVRAKVSGEWAEFGFVCQVTTPSAAATPKLGNFNNEEEGEMPVSKAGFKLTVFPNPSRGEAVRISLTGDGIPESEISMEIFDILGNKVFSRYSMNPEENDLLAEINNHNEFPPGIYILNVVAENKNYFERIIIK